MLSSPGDDIKPEENDGDSIKSALNIDQLLKSKDIKPQHEWGWQVAVYLYLAGIGAGSVAMGILMGWLGHVPDDLRPFMLWGSIMVAIGALFLVLKLGIKRRFLNTILNPGTSWLSRGFYILSACIVIGVVILAISILPYLGINISKWTYLISILDVICFILALATAIYTGILIQSVKYVAFWNTPLLPALFTVSSLSTGAMAALLSAMIYNGFTTSAGFPDELISTLSTIELVIIVIESIVLIMYLLTRYKAEEYGNYSVRLLLSGKLKYVFWAGIVAAGFVFPLILEGFYSLFHEQHLLIFISGAFVLLGGFFLRYAVVYAGIKEHSPLRKLIENQRYTKPLSKDDIYIKDELIEWSSKDAG